jgi:uncharacterized protein (DUF1330 family)
MSAYWICVYKAVHDPDKVAAYAELAGPALRGAGGRFLARGLPEAHDSEDYQAALVALGDGAERDLRVVPGA